MVYNSSIDAVKELILIAENGGYVSWISDKDSRLINGLDYCLVEVTCSNGAQYAIQTTIKYFRNPKLEPLCSYPDICRYPPDRLA